MNKYTICWKKKALRPSVRKKVLDRFGWADSMTINGESVVDVREEDESDFLEIVKRGFIEIRNK